jgi:hypothetical protein
MTKYAKLDRFLRGQTGRWQTMSFGQIEGILGFPLPSSARDHRGWWSEHKTHTHTKGWTDAGWRVWSVDLGAERVEFQRTGPELAAGVSDSPAAPFHHQASAPQAADLVTFDRAKLNIAARRILNDYTAEFGGDVQRALDKALEEARIASVQRLIDSIPRSAPSPVSSVDLIREDRDAR